MDIAVERMTGIAFLVISVSHILQPKGWALFFSQLVERGIPGAFINGMLSLSLGVIIVGFHGTIWNGWPALVTFLGWAQVFKGTLNLCIPRYGLRSMAHVTVETAWKSVAAGCLMLPAGVGMIAMSMR